MEELNKDFLYFPMLVSNTGTAERMSSEEDVAIWKAFQALPKNKQDILTDEQIPKKIKDWQQKFRLSEKEVGMVSLAVRKMFFGELNTGSATEFLANAFAGSAASQSVSSIVAGIQNDIFTLQPKPKKEEVEKEEKIELETVSLPLLQALSKYEQLGNQLITNERIKIKSQAEPVRPSLLYWLKYYRDELGVGHHDSVQRGQFLFRSENGKKLSAEERERVNLILKSVEENLPLQIDTLRSEIIFPRFETSTATAPAALPVQPEAGEPTPETSKETPEQFIPVVPDRKFHIGRGFHFGESKPITAPKEGALSFSSSHVFPAEKEHMTPKDAHSRPVSQQSNPFHIRPVSMMKKDEDNE